MADHALLLEVRFLGDRYHGTRDWPPSPFRLFQALVAGSYGGRWSAEPSTEKDAAFRWLEGLAAPHITGPAKLDTKGMTTFVPNNDLDAVGGDPRRIAEVRAAKRIQPVLLATDAPLMYAWPFEDGHEHATSICAFAERLHTLGRGVDPAYARGEVLSWREAEDRLLGHGHAIARPVQSGAKPEDPTCPVEGSLDSLKARQTASVTRFLREPDGISFRQPPKSRYKTVAYDRPATRLLFDLRPSTGNRPFRSVSQELATELTLGVRDLAIARLCKAFPDRAREIEYVLGGDSPRPTGAEHATLVGADDRRVRFVPLPTIGHQHADPSIRRIMVMVPPNCPLGVRDVAWALTGQVIETLDWTDPQSGEVLAETILVPSEDDTMLRHYGVDRKARVWQTVTPVALAIERPKGRISGAERANDEARTAGSLMNSLHELGIDTRGLSVRVQPEPFHAKGARSDAFRAAPFRRRALRHVELSFLDPVTGPLILGAGRFHGLGLFAPSESSRPTRPARKETMTDDRHNPQVARLRIEAGPAIEETLRLTDVARMALMAKAGDPVPELAGRDDNGPLRGEISHLHAFYLPEDSDNDGRIDALLIYCRAGFSYAALKALNSVTRVWLPQRPFDQDNGPSEWRVALDEIAAPQAFGSSPLFGKASCWVSVTPLLKARFDKKPPPTFEALVGTYRDQIQLEWRKRFPNEPVPEIEPIVEGDRFVSMMESGERSPGDFVRTRNGRGGLQPDVHGGFFRLRFASEVEGPISLGKHAHFGMGLFGREGS